MAGIRLGLTKLPGQHSEAWDPQTMGPAAGFVFAKCVIFVISVLMNENHLRAAS